MNNDISIYNLIRESQSSDPWIFEKWLKINKPSLEIPYAHIFLAFHYLSEKKSTELPPMTIKQVSPSSDTFELSKSSKDIETSSSDMIKRFAKFYITIPESVSEPDTLTSKQKHSEITPSIAKAVLQGEAGITTSSATKPIIGSLSAGPCVIISMYNKKTKTCAVAHIDALSNPRRVLTMLTHQLTKDSSDHLIVEMATQNTEKNQTLQELQSFILKNKNISLEKIHSSSSLAIDSRTGKTFVDVHHDSMDLGLNPEKRLGKRKTLALLGKTLRVSLIFDGRNS